ncbi:hypothetical protein SFT84_000113 [Escherichia coli]|nr:hypothetical protein [Escherichia coli]EGM6035051.1 hypothetical protein [Escherichia coli]ELV0939161.1 hypothetical protein [Escherichia coli]
MTSDNKQEYTIHIFGQDITSQDGLFRLDEIRRVGIQIGKVEDTEKTMVKRFARTKVGRYLMGPKSGLVKKINMGHLGTSWLVDPVAAIEFGRWLDFEYGLAVTRAFVSMTSSATVQSAVASAEDIKPETKEFIQRHGTGLYIAGREVSQAEYSDYQAVTAGRCEWR